MFIKHCLVMCECSFFSPREKLKMKEREEAWVKIENLAKSNPQVRYSKDEYFNLDLIGRIKVTKVTFIYSSFVEM